MSFSTGVTSTSSLLTFKPSRIDIAWDGSSDGKVVLLPVGVDTNLFTTYEVKAIHVFPEAEDKVVYSTGVTSVYSATAGEPFRNNNTTAPDIAGPFVIGNTLNTATGEIEFELTADNTNYTATLDFATYRTSQASSYQWSLEGSHGAINQILAVGQLVRTPPNAFSTSVSYGTLVQAQTAAY